MIIAIDSLSCLSAATDTGITHSRLSLTISYVSTSACLFVSRIATKGVVNLVKYCITGAYISQYFTKFTDAVCSNLQILISC